MVDEAKREQLRKGLGFLGLAGLFAASPVSAVGFFQEKKSMSIVKDEQGRIVSINNIKFNPDNPLEYKKNAC